MENSVRLHQSYEFWFFSGELRIIATFLGPFSWRYAGADHAYPHQIRRQWALSLVNAYPDSWRALPLHEYIVTLGQRGFEYDEFMVRTQSQPTEVHIICRSTEHL